MDSIGNAIKARNCLKLALSAIHDTEAAMKYIYEANDAMHQIEIDLIQARSGEVDGNTQVIYRVGGKAIGEENKK